MTEPQSALSSTKASYYLDQVAAATRNPHTSSPGLWDDGAELEQTTAQLKDWQHRAELAEHQLQRLQEQVEHPPTTLANSGSVPFSTGPHHTSLRSQGAQGSLSHGVVAGLLAGLLAMAGGAYYGVFVPQLERAKATATGAMELMHTETTSLRQQLEERQAQMATLKRELEEARAEARKAKADTMASARPAGATPKAHRAPKRRAPRARRSARRRRSAARGSLARNIPRANDPIAGLEGL